MKEVLKELTIRLNGSRRFYILFVILTMICSIGIIVITSANIEFNNKIISYNQLYNDTNYYKIGDNFVGEYESSLNESDNKYGKLLALSSELFNSDDFEYFVAYNNPVELKNFIGDDVFLNGYENGNYINSKLNIETEAGDTFSISIAKALWSSQEMFEYFNLKMYSGHLFENTDYEFTQTKSNIQPVVLGYDYTNVYSIGDMIPCDSFFLDNGYLEVVGFIENNSIVYSEKENQINLNRYIILPAKKPIDFVVDENNEKMYDFFTYIRCNGIAATNLTAEDLQVCVSNICDKWDISPSLYVKGALNQRSYVTNLSQSELYELLIPIFITIYIFIFFVYLIYTSSKVNSNLKYYAVLYTFKYAYTEMILSFILENSIIMLISLMSSALISKCLSIILKIRIFGISYIISIIMFILLLTSAIILFTHKLKKTELSEYIRKL